MCGFAGRVNLRSPIFAPQLHAMEQLISHRGPDAHGAHLEGTMGLVHRRLAIVDREGGSQPAYGEGKRVVVVFNGEIYNHLALRRELEARGHQFKTRSDTEAIVHAHEEYGVEAATRLRGMFAYAAWEPERRRLTLVRDRLGIKPLYFATLPSGDLLFASELKALLVEGQVDRRLCEESLSAYLSLRYVPAPRTLLCGVQKLLPGSALVWQEGRIELHRFWRVPVVHPGPAAIPPTFAEAGGKLCELLGEVIDLHRLGEVPIGTFLSGGLDSTLVTALLADAARRQGAAPPTTFAVGFSGARTAPYDELTWARSAAAALGTRHEEIVVTGDEVASALPRIAWHLDEPLGDPAAAPLWFLARRARESVTVVLSGEGGDEVFAGYARYRHATIAERLRGVPGVPTLAEAARRLVPHSRLRRALGLLALPLEAHYLGVARAFAKDERPPFGQGDGERKALADAWAHARRAPTPLSRLLAFDQQVWLPDDLLLKADRATMAHALELRVPLLDHLLVEEVASWPDEWKLFGMQGKHILRRVAAGLVPEPILARPKMGFATPANLWLAGALRGLCHELLLSRKSLATERGGTGVVTGLLQEHAARANRGAELWTLLSLELWRAEVASKVPVVHGTPTFDTTLLG